MALIPKRKVFISAVVSMAVLDMSAQAAIFPEGTPRTTSLIEFDHVEIENTSADYHSFAETSKTVTKDGFSTTTYGPLNFNESISKEKIEADARKFGQTEYGEGQVHPEVQAALSGVAKLQKRAMVGTKRAMYEALTLHKITNGYKGDNGFEDIVFAVPVANKKVLTNTGDEIYWNTVATAKPVTNIYAAFKAMKNKPSMVVMSSDTYGDFYSNAEVRTADNSSTGTKKNYTDNENVDPEAKFFRAGRLRHKEMAIDVYVESDTYKVGATDTLYLEDKYVILTSRGAGSTEYAGIPVAEEGGVRNIAAKVDAREVIKSDPPVHKVVHRSAPLPLIKDGNSFYSMQVKA